MDHGACRCARDRVLPRGLSFVFALPWHRRTRVVGCRDRVVYRRGVREGVRTHAAIDVSAGGCAVAAELPPSAGFSHLAAICRLDRRRGGLFFLPPSGTRGE